jgi:hypothetical protein
MNMGLELSKCLMVAVCLVPIGCGGSDSNSNAAAGGTSGVGGSSSTSGGSTTKSSSGAGGSTATSSSTGGATSNYWPSAYSSTGTASTPYHTTNPAGSVPCMTCHGPTSPSALSTIKLVFGGQVFKSDGTTPAGNVQIGVSDGTKKFFVYSAPNGYYWQLGTDTVTWTSADIRTRSANGEHIKKATDDRNADCDSCHSATSTTATPLKAP